jgi:hypothetical protein
MALHLCGHDEGDVVCQVVERLKGAITESGEGEEYKQKKKKNRK